MTPAQAQTVIPLVVIVPIVLLVVWRNMKSRRVRLEGLWVRPAILIAATALVVAQTGAPSPALAAVMAAALVVGAGLGWLRGRMVRITVDPETHLVSGQSSVLGVVFILALIAVRFGARTFVAENAGALHMNLAQATDVLLAMVVGLVVAQQLEIWLRARAMVAISVAAKAAQSGAPRVSS